MSLFAKVRKAREEKKGFTLVELIVVLVILAILAAILVPALTKWINKADEKQVVVDARTAYLAAQTIASEKYAKGGTDNNGTITDADIKALADVKGTSTFSYDTTTGKIKGGGTYTDGDVTATLEISSNGDASWSTSAGTTGGTTSTQTEGINK